VKQGRQQQHLGAVVASGDAAQEVISDCYNQPTKGIF